MPVPYVYSCVAAGAWPDPEYVVRARDSRAIVASLRDLVHRLDPGRAVFGVRPLGDVVSGTLEEPRLGAAMLGVFAASALALASLGLYSLFMLLVAESTREIGVRLALGASPSQVMRLVVAGAGRLCLAGVVAGLVLSAAAQRLLVAVLYGVRPLDPLTLAVTTVTLGMATALAVLVPALRAGRIDPIVAMRVE
jgi:ABC-type antimicrobial peptide transport system permease subunit